MPKRNSIRLTDTFIRKSVSAPQSGRVEIFDGVVDNLCLRVSHTGTRSWAVYYRLHGRNRKYTIGKYPVFSLEEARAAAAVVRKKADQGIDPVAERRQLRATESFPETVGSIVAEFMEKYVKVRNKSWRSSETIFRTWILPRWYSRELKSITRSDINLLLDEVSSKRSLVRANRVRAQLGKFFNWAIERDYIDHSPVNGISPPGKEVSRDRVLDDMELSAVWHASGNAGHPFDALIKILILTGQRHGETVRMKWSDIDLDTGKWTIPRENTKADRLHDVHLSDLACDVIRNIPKIDNCSHVFVSGRAGNRPTTGLAKAKSRVDLASGITDWRIHDLRRTLATGMAKLGVSLQVTEKVLNHAVGGSSLRGVAGVYNRYDYGDERIAALDVWSGYVAKLINKVD